MTFPLMPAVPPDFYFPFNISSNVGNVNLRTLAVAAGWDQSLFVLATIDAGVIVGSSSVASSAMTINGSFPNGVKLINNGVILGHGGVGGAGGSRSPGAGAAGSAGGMALTVSIPVFIDNANGIIGGGGGGGGGSGGVLSTFIWNSPSYGSGTSASIYMGGAGGGGGISLYTTAGGAAGQVGQASATTAGYPTYGGTTYPGNDGGGGSRGSGGYGSTIYWSGTATSGQTTASPANGGSGGSYGAAGATPGLGSATTKAVGGAGGAAGACLSGNSFINWDNTGQRYGTIT